MPEEVRCKYFLLPVAAKIVKTAVARDRGQGTATRALDFEIIFISFIDSPNPFQKNYKIHIVLTITIIYYVRRYILARKKRQLLLTT